MASEHHLNVVDEYIDDGWSGTNFERPSFQRITVHSHIYLRVSLKASVMNGQLPMSRRY